MRSEGGVNLLLRVSSRAIRASSWPSRVTRSRRSELVTNCMQRLALLRTARRWEELIELDPMREEGYRELMPEAVAAGQSVRAVRLYGRLRTTPAHELSISPSADVEEIYAEAVDSLTPAVEAGGQTGGPRHRCHCASPG